jgi:hypothetical protein
MKSNLQFILFFFLFVFDASAQGLNASFSVVNHELTAKAVEPIFGESIAINNGDGTYSITHLKNPFSVKEVKSFVALSISAEHLDNTLIEFNMRYLDNGIWSDWVALSNSVDIGSEQKTISQIFELPKTFSEVELKVEGEVSLIKARLYNPAAKAKAFEKSSVPEQVQEIQSCPCDQPSYTTRSQWNCPDGNSPSCSP